MDSSSKIGDSKQGNNSVVKYIEELHGIRLAFQNFTVVDQIVQYYIKLKLTSLHHLKGSTNYLYHIIRYPSQINPRYKIKFRSNNEQRKDNKSWMNYHCQKRSH